jgi:hypothetical protein
VCGANDFFQHEATLKEVGERKLIRNGGKGINMKTTKKIKETRKNGDRKQQIN